jgi:hypothetical protein
MDEAPRTIDSIHVFLSKKPASQRLGSSGLGRPASISRGLYACLVGWNSTGRSIGSVWKAVVHAIHKMPIMGCKRMQAMGADIDQ